MGEPNGCAVPDTVWKKSSKLGKEATALKKAERFNEAADKMREKIDLESKHRILDPSTACRLPAYLYLAGKVRDAWREYGMVAHCVYSPWAVKDLAKQCSFMEAAYASLASMLKQEGLIEQALAYDLAGFAAGENGQWVSWKADEELARQTKQKNWRGPWAVDASSLALTIEEHMKNSTPEDKKTVTQAAMKAAEAHRNPDVFLQEMCEMLDCPVNPYA